jgi:SAM-dependent methyltransferase
MKERMRQLIENERTVKYPDEEYYPLTGGPGGIYLTDQICERLDLRPGQRVLELGPGHLVSSIFIAREYGCTVYAFDLWVAAEYNYQTIERCGLQDRIIPLQGDAMRMPFAYGYFDRIFSMDSYFYYGGTPEFTTYVARFLKPGGLLGFGEWCPVSEESRELMWSIYGKHEPDSVLVHSPQWWKLLLEQNGEFEVVHSGFAEKGFEMHEDWGEKTWALRLTPPWGGFDSEAEMRRYFEELRNDVGRCKSHHVTIARRARGRE